VLVATAAAAKLRLLGTSFKHSIIIMLPNGTSFKHSMYTLSIVQSRTPPPLLSPHNPTAIIIIIIIQPLYMYKNETWIGSWNPRSMQPQLTQPTQRCAHPSADLLLVLLNMLLQLQHVLDKTLVKLCQLE
jgi:hypothetical protein